MSDRKPQHRFHSKSVNVGEGGPMSNRPNVKTGGRGRTREGGE